MYSAGDAVYLNETISLNSSHNFIHLSEMNHFGAANPPTVGDSQDVPVFIPAEPDDEP